MFSSCARKILPLFKELRNLSGGLILDAKSVTKKKTAKALEIKKVSKKKPRKKQIIVKRASDDIEAIWLENLNNENLALYRKTSYGSFRKINLTKLLKRLQQIYPAQLENVQNTSVKPLPQKKEPTQKELPSDEEISITETKSQPDSESPTGSPPYMSQYLITHIMEFPMLKTTRDTPAVDFMKQENENFGAVDAVKFPSVTGILNETMSESSRKRLKMWRERMIAQMGAEEFQKYYRDLLQQGSKFHSTLKTYLEIGDKNLVKVDPEIKGCWESLENFFSELDDVRFVEEAVHHPILLYKGILDCVASYRGTPCLIEWKKSNNLKYSLMDTYDAPIQVSAYLGALPWNKNLEIEKGIVVVVYTDGTPANVLEMTLDSCEVYWKEWLRRVQTYWLKKSALVVEQKTEM